MPILIALIVVVCLIALAIGSLSDSGGGGDQGPDDIGASLVCQKFMKDRLKAPSTAKFPSTREDIVTKQTDIRYEVISYVDAENSFGAMIRTEYMCTVEYAGNDQWKLIDLTTQ